VIRAKISWRNGTSAAAVFSLSSCRSASSARLGPTDIADHLGKRKKDSSTFAGR
jgi:hypothetical protein